MPFIVHTYGTSAQVIGLERRGDAGERTAAGHWLRAGNKPAVFGSPEKNTRTAPRLDVKSILYLSFFFLLILLVDSKMIVYLSLLHSQGRFDAKKAQLLYTPIYTAGTHLSPFSHHQQVATFIVATCFSHQRVVAFTVAPWFRLDTVVVGGTILGAYRQQHPRGLLAG